MRYNPDCNWAVTIYLHHQSLNNRYFIHSHFGDRLKLASSLSQLSVKINHQILTKEGGLIDKGRNN